MTRRTKGVASEPPSDDAEASFEEFKAQVGARVKELRMMQGLNKLAAGEFTGVGAPQLSRIENGGVNMTLRVIYRLAQGLGVPPHELLVPREQSAVLPRTARKARRGA